MALTAGVHHHIRPSGNNANGGSFNPGNANFPTDLTTDANTANTSAPVVSSASYSFVAGDVGAWLFVSTGTNWLKGWWPIVSVAGGKATLNAAIGAGVRYNVAGNGQASVPTTAVGIASVGTPTSGTWGIDYTYLDTAPFSFTDLAFDGTNRDRFTSAAKPVGKNYVGNHVNIASGTGATAGLYEVVSTSGTTATVDRNWHSASGATSDGVAKLGGGYATFANFNVGDVTNQVNVQIFLIKGPNTYTHSAQIYLLQAYIMIGYGSVPTDMDAANRPVIQNTFNGACFGLNGAAPYYGVHSNIEFDGNNVTSSTSFAYVAGVAVFNANFSQCVFRRYKVDGFSYGSSTNVMVRCTFKDNTGAGFNTSQGSCFLWGCVFRDNTTDGVGAASSNQSVLASRCIFARNGGQGINAYNIYCYECLIYKNTGNGIGSSITNFQSATAKNSIIYGNGGYGDAQDYQAISSNAYSFQDNQFLAMGSNTSGDFRSKPTPKYGYIQLTADPCTDGVNNDFSLNNTVGGGALCRAAGFPGTLEDPTTGYTDIGPIQHQDSGGGSAGMLFIPNLEGV